MSRKIVINPVTRISGFMELSVDLEGNTVADARTEGLLFRGFEKMLRGRSPFDAIYFTQRICGICSTAHSVASSMALEEALGLAVPTQGRYLRDILHACEFLQNHIRHFYQYTVPDYIRLPEKNPLFDSANTDFRLPKPKNDRIVRHYFDSLEVSRSAHRMLAILGGKAPHNQGVFVGGVAARATPEDIAQMRAILRNIRVFLCEKMIPDAYTIAEYYREYFDLGRGYGNLMSYGCFDSCDQLGTLYVNPLVYRDGAITPLSPAEITENVHSSWYRAQPQTYTPYEIIAEPDTARGGAYSWVKAPRYGGLPFEVGPLARMWLCGEYRNGISAMDRTLARVLEAKKITGIIRILLDHLTPCVSTQAEYRVPENAFGSGLTDTARGALGHWLKIDDRVLSFYQIITPSAWNLSTRGEDGLPGPAEKALIGVPVADLKNPVELGRILRTFDPCVSCATHVYTNGQETATLQIVP